MANANYAELVAKAEAAVAAVADPELKAIAFQKVLDDLLGSGSAPETEAPGKPKRKARASARSAASSNKGASAKGGPQAYIQELADEDFFEKPKTIAHVKAELESRGHHIPLTSLSGPLQTLCQKRVLRRQKQTVGKRQTFAYTNW